MWPSNLRIRSCFSDLGINGYQYSGVHHYGDRWSNLMIGSGLGNGSELVSVKCPGG